MKLKIPLNWNFEGVTDLSNRPIFKISDFYGSAFPKSASLTNLRQNSFI